MCDTPYNNKIILCLSWFHLQFVPTIFTSPSSNLSWPLNLCGGMSSFSPWTPLPRVNLLGHAAFPFFPFPFQPFPFISDGSMGSMASFAWRIMSSPFCCACSLVCFAKADFPFFFANSSCSRLSIITFVLKWAGNFFAMFLIMDITISHLYCTSSISGVSEKCFSVEVARGHLSNNHPVTLTLLHSPCHTHPVTLTLSHSPCYTDPVNLHSPCKHALTLM